MSVITMTPIKTTKHIHQYHRDKLGAKTIYKCELPGCTHYLYKQFVPNKIGLCPICGNPFLLNKRNMRNARPHCDDCTKSRIPETAIKAIAALLGDDKED